MVQLAQPRSRSAWALIHRVPWRRLLPGQRPERDQNASGGVPDFLRDCESGRGGRGRDRPRKRIARRNRGLSPKGHEGEEDGAWRKNLLRQLSYKL
jgi:hypothetical protein